jgi:acetoin utilization protein AcuB
MQIDEIMMRAPRTITSGTTIGEAWDVLGTLELRHLPVTNENRELIGIVSDGEFSIWPTTSLSTKRLENQTVPRDAPISTIMMGTPISVEPDDCVEDVYQLMHKIKAGALPVLGPDDEVVGIVSYLDILRSLPEGARPSV